jgi:CheY-like chemotaxis protein
MSKRILVVDDQEDLRGVLRDLLTGSGYAVIVAARRDLTAISEAGGVRRVARDQRPTFSEGQGASTILCDEWPLLRPRSIVSAEGAARHD